MQDFKNISLCIPPKVSLSLRPLILLGLTCNLKVSNTIVSHLDCVFIEISSFVSCPILPS